MEDPIQPEDTGEVVTTRTAKLISLFLVYYPQYTLDHVFHRTFRQGGLTRDQITILFTHASEAEYNRLRTQALFVSCTLGGTDPNDLISSKGSRVEKTSTASHQSLPDQSPVFPAFRHPDEYKNLSQDEKDTLTKRMMKAHQAWAQTESSLTDFGKDVEHAKGS